MGLDLIPQHDPCQEIRRLDMKVPGVTLTIPEGWLCPLKGASKYQGVFGTECWCRGKVAANELRAFGYDDECDQMYEDLGPDKAVESSARLSVIAIELRAKYPDTKTAPARGASGPVEIDIDSKEVTMPERSSFDEALAAIEDTAGWYKAVGELGSGVVAWS